MDDEANSLEHMARPSARVRSSDERERAVMNVMRRATVADVTHAARDAKKRKPRPTDGLTLRVYASVRTTQA